MRRQTRHRLAAIAAFVTAPVLSYLYAWAFEYLVIIGSVAGEIGIAAGALCAVVIGGIPTYGLGRCVRNGVPGSTRLAAVIYSSLCASWFYLVALNDPFIPGTHFVAGLLLHIIGFAGARGQPPTLDPDECTNCGYDLIGLASEGNCPECGEPFRKPPPPARAKKVNRVG